MFNLRADEFKVDRRPPPDPIMQGARGERMINYNSAVGRWLFHQSHMPLGEHAGKIMQRVPAAYLLHVAKQPYARQRNWFPVLSYVQRHRQEIEERAKSEQASPGPVPTGPTSTPVFGLPHIRRITGTNKLTCQCGESCTIDASNEWKAWLTAHCDHTPSDIQP